jgi:alanine-glyoxylate transaminase/serine-glyoxylate transaminase/serine-pyruvate transaminase
MNVPMQEMRAHADGAMTTTQPLVDGLKRVFQQRRGRMFVVPGSPTAAWEAAVTNTLDPGDKVLTARHGEFSRRWVELAAKHGLEVEVVDAPWGDAVPVQELARRLEADREGRIKAVFVTHNETATGVTSPVPAMREVLDELDHSALLFVDGTSSIGAIDFRMEAWGVDLAVCGSQQGFMMPAGLAMLAAGDRAMAASQRTRGRPAHFDFAEMARLNDDGALPYAPPTTLFRGLEAALDLLFAEGLDQVFARHRRLAEGVRRGVRAWGLETVARDPRFQSNTVTAVRVPPEVDAREVVRIADDRYRTSFGAGLGPLDGKAFRIAHLGDLNEVMCLSALAAAEIALKEAGCRIQLGAGVGAAQSWFQANGTAEDMLRAVA